MRFRCGCGSAGWIWWSLSVSTNYTAFKLTLISCIKREVAECRTRTIIKLLTRFSLWGRNPQFYGVVLISVCSGVSGFMQQNCAQNALLEGCVHKFLSPGHLCAVICSIQTSHWGTRAPGVNFEAPRRDKSQISERCTYRQLYTYVPYLNGTEFSITTRYQFSYRRKAIYQTVIFILKHLVRNGTSWSCCWSLGGLGPLPAFI